jgi:hypothetical protein
LTSRWVCSIRERELFGIILRATGSTIPEETREREANMAGEIRRLMEENRKGKILHVGGWEHLVEALHGNSLLARLEDLKPRRLLLEDNI